MEKGTLDIRGDIHTASELRILDPPADVRALRFNKRPVKFSTDRKTGEWIGTLEYERPRVRLPDLSSLDWRYIDGLPEISTRYDDSLWLRADQQVPTEQRSTVGTPVSLIGGDYGFHSGALVFRGKFTATGMETWLFLKTQGGVAFGSSLWLDSVHLGSWTGLANDADHNGTYPLPTLTAGRQYNLTVLVDNNGYEENWWVGPDAMKTPRGILNYTLAGREQSAISWKITGNLGGEEYVDKARGPLNEGGLYAERQGYTQPYAPSSLWPRAKPDTGIKAAGVGFYQASFDLDMPEGYDTPLQFNFGNTTMNGKVANYRALLFVNGYQFGKYVNNIGPQNSFPIPQGKTTIYT